MLREQLMINHCTTFARTDDLSTEADHVVVDQMNALHSKITLLTGNKLVITDFIVFEEVPSLEGYHAVYVRTRDNQKSTFSV